MAKSGAWTGSLRFILTTRAYIPSFARAAADVDGYRDNRKLNPKLREAGIFRTAFESRYGDGTY